MTVEHITIETPGLRFAALAAGEGPLVLCLHGFPDTAHSWDSLLGPLADAGFRAVAPWMRGYHPTGIPDDGDYSMQALGRDAVALIDALGAEDAALVGYDWGATAVYMAAAQAPDRIRRIVTSAIPHARGLNTRPLLLLKAWHFAYFQLPWAAWGVRRNDFELLRKLFRQWSPNWRWDESELAPVKESFSHPESLRAALGYYRALKANPFGREFRETQRLLGQRVACPGLVFAGSSDLIPFEVFRAAEAGYAGGHELVEVDGPGHFLHREVPELFADKVVEFLSPDL